MNDKKARAMAGGAIHNSQQITQDGVEKIINQRTEAGFKLWVGTLAQYNALTPDADTLYLVQE